MNFLNHLENQVLKLKNNVKILVLDDSEPEIQKAINNIPLEAKIKIFKIIDFVNLKNVSEVDSYIVRYLEIRNGKDDYVQAKEFFAKYKDVLCSLILLYDGVIDGIVGGLNLTSAEFLRNIFKIIKPKNNNEIASSTIILTKEEQTLFLSDPSVNININKKVLFNIAKNQIEFIKTLNKKANYALLSYSTNGSVKNKNTEIIREVTYELQKYHPELNILGEIQVDAALNLKIRNKKLDYLTFEEKCNAFIFPNLESANISYKFLEQISGFIAIGPILNGLSKPCNDLSRGSNWQDILYTIYITCLQAQGDKDE
ncbi:phosphate acyltransferase [Mycoplasma leonicaptivi]|uniref:phosphate acyltransferase n=1 Tax=Mycoplasma leonicaptivi TaxID=36742 RepID=UPI000488A3FB|nr:phosphate acyltransferase [Mycoplasma leonicaptivi]